MFSQKEKSVIYEAFDMYYLDYCKTLPSNEELSYITFTKEFEEKMEKLIERERKFYFYWINTASKRVAIVILAIIISLTSITFSVKAIREPVIRFVVETFQKFSNVIFTNDKSEDNILLDDNFTLEIVKPNYIPDGYILESEYNDIMGYQAMYVNNDSSIMYMQLVNDESVVQANTENVTYENIIINGLDAISYYNKGVNTIILSTNKYVYTVEGSISKDILIKIAESINIKLFFCHKSTFFSFYYII